MTHKIIRIPKVKDPGIFVTDLLFSQDFKKIKCILWGLIIIILIPGVNSVALTSVLKCI